MTPEEIIAAIEARVAWLHLREARGTGYGQDTRHKVTARIVGLLADLRTELSLDPAELPDSFTAEIYDGE